MVHVLQDLWSLGSIDTAVIDGIEQIERYYILGIHIRHPALWGCLACSLTPNFRLCSRSLPCTEMAGFDTR